MKQNFILMADYNNWMNQRVLGAASKLDATELAAHRGAFFGSIIGTLNHLLVGDILWLQRFAGHQHHFESLEPVRSLDTPQSLDAILYFEFAELETARTSLDGTITRFVDELSEAVLAVPLTYTNTKGVSHRKSFPLLLQHFFNHQTHHRGQVTTLLTRAGVDVGETDLLLRIPDT